MSLDHEPMSRQVPQEVKKSTPPADPELMKAKNHARKALQILKEAMGQGGNSNRIE